MQKTHCLARILIDAIPGWSTPSLPRLRASERSADAHTTIDLTGVINHGDSDAIIPRYMRLYVLLPSISFIAECPNALTEAVVSNRLRCGSH